MPTWLTLVLALGGSALITLIVGTIWRYLENRVRKYKEEKEAEQAKVKELERERKERMKEEENIRRAEEWKATVVNLIAPIDEKITVIKQTIETNQQATVVTMRSNMKSLRDAYRLQGFADAGDKATWEELYNRYKDMGGNHFKEYVDAWRAEVKSLPLERPKSDNKESQKQSK